MTEEEKTNEEVTTEDTPEVTTEDTPEETPETTPEETEGEEKKKKLTPLELKRQRRADAKARKNR